MLEELSKGTLISDDYYVMGIMEGNDHAMRKIAAAPAVDAVEVVRCVKCAWYREEEHICVNPRCTKSYYGCRVRQDHFCSYGERRADDATN